MPEPTAADEWQDAPDDPNLSAGEVHVWHLHPLSVAAPTDWSVLSVDERANAARFHFDRDRDRYVTCRAALRRVLGSYLQTRAETIEFAYGPHGKLRLGEPGPGLHFNVSHSPNHALIAIGLNHEVGVDVEEPRDELDPVSLANQFFAPLEQRFVQSSPPEQRFEAFLQCWTRKEAWMKALGTGLSRELKSFDVSATLRAGGGVVADPAGARDWRLVELRPSGTAVGALAAGARLTCVRLWRWCG